MSLAGFNEVFGQFPTFEDGTGAVGDEEGGAGVEEDGIAFGAAFNAPEDATEDGGVFVAVAAGQVVHGGGLDGETLEGEGADGEPAFVMELGDGGIADGGEFVEVPGRGMAADDHGAAEAELLEDLGDGLAEIGVGYAHQLAVGSGGVKEGAEDIEHGALAAFGADFTGGSDVAESGVIAWGEEEGEMLVAQGGGGQVGGEFDGDAEGFEDVGAAGSGSDGAIAVFGDGHTGASDEQGDGGGDIEGMLTVAAGAADIEETGMAGGGIDGDRHGAIAEGGGEGGDFGGGFAALGEGDEEVSFGLGGEVFAGEGVEGGEEVGGWQFAEAGAFGENVDHGVRVGEVK